MTDECLLDTNILVYAIDGTDKRKHDIAKELVEDCFRGKGIAVTLQNLAEFFAITTKKIKNPLSHKEAAEIVQMLIELKDLKKLALKEKTLIKAIELSPASFWDSMIAATMLENGITDIYTENVKDFQIPGITAINPFK